MYDVITLGSGTIDVFANTEAQFTKKSGKELISYPTGSKILIHELKFEIGGGGTNTAVAFSRLGLKTAWLGKLGNDDTSLHILDFMRKNSIEFIGVKGKGMSGFSIILDSRGHDRTILTHKGENDTLRYNQINLSKLRTKWFYFSSMVGKSLEMQKKLASYAGKKGIKLAFNPSSYQAEMGAKKLSQILRNTTSLIFNLEEAELLLGRKDSIENIMKKLTRLGPRIIVITNGKKEVFCYDGSMLYTLYPHGVKIIETTGAGDAFASSFVTGIILKNDIEFALKLGLANAESVIQHYGAKNVLLSFSEARRRMKIPTRITKRKI